MPVSILFLRKTFVTFCACVRFFTSLTKNMLESQNDRKIIQLPNWITEYSLSLSFTHMCFRVFSQFSCCWKDAFAYETLKIRTTWVIFVVFVHHFIIDQFNTAVIAFKWWLPLYVVFISHVLLRIRQEHVEKQKNFSWEMRETTHIWHYLIVMWKHEFFFTKMACEIRW